MALEVCAADASDVDRRRTTPSQPSPSSRTKGVSGRSSVDGISAGASTTSASGWNPQLPQKPNTAAPLGFRARLEGQIAGAKRVVKSMTPPSTVVSKREFVKVKSRAAKQPQALQLDRRMTIDEMKDWYRSTVRPDKEESGRAIPIPGFTRLRRLGKGGFGEVWDVRAESSGHCYALKHIAVAHSASAISEIRVGTLLFPRVCLEVDASSLQLVTPIAKHKTVITTRQHETELALDSDISNTPHIDAPFTELFRVFQENRDFWLLYERGGRTLHELAFGIHGEFHKGSRVYRLEHRALYQQMRADPAIVQSLLKQLLEAVKMLSERQIVHADIKPDNILLQWRGRVLPPPTSSNQTPNVKEQQQAPSRTIGLCVQLIDFGSAFTTERNRYPPATQSSKTSGGGGGTPEYVPPEALVPSAPPSPLRPQSSSSLKPTSTTTIVDSSESLLIQSTNSHSSSFDMWSVGAVFLELLSGFPLWFGYRSRIELQGKEYWVNNGGLFTTKYRDPARIQQRQLQVVEDIERSLQSFHAGMVHDWPKQIVDLALDLLRQLLDPSPKTRVTPDAALLHPFFDVT